MERCGHLHPVSLDDALLGDGYSALAHVLDRRTAEDVSEELEAPACVVVSGEEGIPGLFTDRHLMEGDPHRVLEGLVIAAHAARTTLGIIQINGAARLTLQRMARALAKAQAAGLIGDRILGSAFSFHVEIRQEARGSSRGAERVSSVATLAALPRLIAEGNGGRASPGRSATTLCGVSGPVDRPGIVEIDGGVTLRELLSDVAGGLRHGRDPKRVLVVGPSGVPVSAESLDVPVESLAVSSAGAGVIVVPDDDLVGGPHMAPRTAERRDG